MVVRTPKNLFLAGLLAVTVDVSARFLEEQVQRTHKEVVAGVVFVYESLANERGFNERWLINGEQVDEQEFSSKKCAALAQEALESLQKEQRKLRDEALRAQELRLAGGRKLLSLTIRGVGTKLARLLQPLIEPYYQFCADCVTREAWEELLQEKMPYAKACARGEKSADYEELRSLCTYLEAIGERLERFYEKTMRYALEHCGDTETLKLLLELV